MTTCPSENANETTKVKINGSIAYSPQKPWIMTGTIEENIVFFGEYDYERLNKCVYYACLTDDLRLLTSGLKT